MHLRAFLRVSKLNSCPGRAQDKKALKKKQQDAEDQRKIISSFDASEAVPYVQELKGIEQIAGRLDASIGKLKDKQALYCTSLGR